MDIEYIIDILDKYKNKPLNINKADQEDFESLFLLTERQIISILNYRNQYGEFLSLYELQAVPLMDLKSVNRIRPFTSTFGANKKYYKRILPMMTQGRSNLYLKWKTTLEDKKGYQSINGDEPTYLGDKNHYTVRYKYNFENKLRYGFTMEKDDGEEFFKGSNKNGFDYYSAYIHLKDYNRYIKSISIGDFNVSLGQGLIISNNFGGRKSSFTTAIKKSGRIFRPYSSLSENKYNRGVATEINISRNISIAGFTSFKHRDAGVVIDSLDGEETSYFSALLQDGYHRTHQEINKKDALKQTSLGGRIKYRSQNFQVSFNALHDRFDANLQRSDQAYNKFRFSGTQLTNISIDYSFKWKNAYFFGESAKSQNNKMAHLVGLLINPHPTTSLAILYRNYDKAYQVLNSNSFSETSGTNDEIGLYIGIEQKLNRNWSIAAYTDRWSHQWAKFKQAFPSKGNEYLFKLRYYKKRKFEAYIQYFYELKKVNDSRSETKFKALSTKNLQRFRIHFSHKLNKSFELRNRIEFSFHKMGESTSGYLIYQDIIFKSNRYPLSFTARFSIFDAQDYDARIYAYENDILYEFYIPAYYKKGSRYYINLRYRLNRNITTEFRYSRTQLPGFKSIGSGSESILGDTRTNIKAQIKLSF